MSSRAENGVPLFAQRRKHHMPSLASREKRPARPRRTITPNAVAEVHVEVAQKVTPWKNHLAETTPPIGNFARPPVTPCHAIPGPPLAACYPSPKRGVFRILVVFDIEVVRAPLPKLREGRRETRAGKRKVGVAKPSDNARIEPLRARQFAFVLGSGRACGAKG